MAESLGPDVSVVELEATLQKLETEVTPSSDTFVMTTVYSNRTAKPMYPVGEQKLWPGTVPGSYPIIVQPTANVSGSHIATLPPPAGVKFGRVYADAQDELPTTRKFIVAFDSAAGKVYAETGPIGPVDWNVVEDRLGKSERTTVVVDNILGGKIEAGIYANGNGYARFMDA